MSTDLSPIQLRYQRQLKQLLTRHFSMEEIRSLCFDLGVDFDELAGGSKTSKIEALLSRYQSRNGWMGQLVEQGKAVRPDLDWSNRANVFIAYKRHAETDRRLAQFLHESLNAIGHFVFIDQTMRTGTAWLDEVDRQIKTADFLVVLLSAQSADSEMVQSEIRRAHDYRQAQGYPQILPVRVNYSGLLPYSIDAFLDPYQYTVWNETADDTRLAADVLSAIAGDLDNKRPLSLPAQTTTYSDDGRAMATDELDSPPLPAFDPRFLETLHAPDGAVRLSDQFYIERKDDVQLKRQLFNAGTITTIRAARQTGKSSLLVRRIHHARQQGRQVVALDLQRIDSDALTGIDKFLYYLALTVVRVLRLDKESIDRFWREPLGPQDKLTYFMEDHVLPNMNNPLVLAIDEADRLLDTGFYEEFFGLIRAWHNSAAYDERWERLNMALVISTEPFLLIQDPNQSPFNVGLKLYLKDFTQAQVADLNRLHRSPLNTADLPSFMRLLDGQPYLTRKALYTMLTEELNWTALAKISATDQGPFGDHQNFPFPTTFLRPSAMCSTSVPPIVAFTA